MPFDFDLVPVDTNEVVDALKKINIKKFAGPGGLAPYFSQIAAECIAEPLMHIFNLTIETEMIPTVWRAAYVTPLG